MESAPATRGGRPAVPSMVDVAALAGVSVGTVSNAVNHPQKVRPATLAKVRAAIEELGFSSDGAGRRVRPAVPSMVEVAALAGVSVGTVSNVINRPDKVRPETLGKVRAAIHELGFSLNANARSLAGGENRTIGLVVIDLFNTLFVDIARGAQREAAEHGMSVLIANSDSDDEQQNANLDQFESARVGAVLLAPLSDPGASVQRMRRHHTPVAVLNYDSGRDDYCQVLVDNQRVGFLAAQHMIDLGRRRLAFVRELSDLQPVQERQVGIRRAVRQDNSGATLTEFDAGDFSGVGAPAVVAAVLALPPGQRPDALIAVTDLLAAAVIEELRSAGVAVPGEIAVMGCDYDARAWGGDIPLTTVRLGGDEMGAAAVRQLIEELTQGERHRHHTVVIEPSLVVRESSAGRGASRS